MRTSEKVITVILVSLIIAFIFAAVLAVVQHDERQAEQVEYRKKYVGKTCIFLDQKVIVTDAFLFSDRVKLIFPTGESNTIPPSSIDWDSCI